jgi:hypothetical protein
MSVGQPTEEPSDARIKHLEFVQAVIARQASNSFLLKGWALTVAAAFFGFVATQLHWEVALVALLPVIVFWFLDAYYLRPVAGPVARVFCPCRYSSSRSACSTPSRSGMR